MSVIPTILSSRIDDSRMLFSAGLGSHFFTLSLDKTAGNRRVDHDRAVDARSCVADRDTAWRGRRRAWWIDRRRRAKLAVRDETGRSHAAIDTPRSFDRR